ncbi:hypothetical protein AURDEDRAFT_178451 [Auricularia subglabra TFB-10046 SS5]|uniref:Uncharacterized protein n=1 Tax=Auricularia subglabra (strain TFB-10046 / SS5) TaxID=717982 RepID=J0WJN1_AURST|nr:hypothetical protein AURDEDRAFT_178451 [Auricularia subglabra TFB-10046 SS5]
MSNLLLRAHYYSKTARRGRNVKLAGNASFASIENILGRTGSRIEQCDVAFWRNGRHHRMMVFFKKRRGGVETNLALRNQFNVNINAEIVVVSCHANAAEPRFGHLRTPALADRAVDLFLDRLRQDGAVPSSITS